jgi:hypothetical protein
VKSLGVSSIGPWLWGLSWQVFEPQRCSALLALFLALGLAPELLSRPVWAQSAAEGSEQFFTEQVLPLLRTHCYECHSHESGEASGNLMLDSLAALTSGGLRGAAITPSQPQQSLLLKALEYADTDLQMPPTGQLPTEQIEVFRRWIAQGAVMPASMHGKLSHQSAGGQPQAATAKEHWAYQPPVPWYESVSDFSQHLDSPIDALVMQQLTAVGLTLAPAAERQVLLRRLSYDLTGLPPTPAAIDSFLSDPQADDRAIEAVVERLLASPAFGERWARMWMDVSRYADNKGYVFQEDREYPGAHQYRSWLIEAFNQDLPYDQFVTQQLAADLLAADGDLPAQGFLTLGRRFLNNKNDIIDDRLDVVARGLMGMTLACARCHDHKYDPITQADYYALYGVFLNTEEPGGEPWPHRLVDSAENRESHILIRGSPGNRGERVDRRFVSVLAPDAEPFAVGSGRRELAAHIVSPDNPLTARVIANRLWLQLTGSSLVESPSDLGLRSPRPTQLPLLDHLAHSLIEHGWSLKRLIHQIVSSRVYQQSSLHREQAYALDPENRLYWKMNRRRIDLEPFRDTLLQRTGLLDERLYGPSESITAVPISHRRTVYAYIDRQNLPPLFRTFDLASPDTHSPVRAQTSVPQQGLYLLNSDFLAELSQQFAQRAEQLAPHAWQQSTWMFEQLLGRVPTDTELKLMLDFLESSATQATASNNASSSSPLELLAGALLAANELVYLD